MSGRWSRRGFVVQVGGALAGLVGGLPATLRGHEAAPAVQGSPFRSDGARAIGRAYLSRIGRTELERVRIRWQPLLSGRDRSWVAETVRRDFALANTVTVRGWMLSRTEAELCALAVAGQRGPA